MLLDLCPKVLSPRNQDFKWGSASYVLPIWGSNARVEAICPDWDQVWPFWALLRYLATALLLGARFCSAMLLALHPKMRPPSRTKVFSGFLRAMLALFGGQVRLSYGHVGTMLGPTSAILGLC